MRRFIGLAFGGFAVQSRLQVLTSDDCKSASFAGRGGKVAVAHCFADSSGVLPAWLASIEMNFVGGVIGFNAIKG